MREVVAQLVEPDRSRWVDALSRIDPALDELEVLGSLSPARTASLVTLIRAEVAALWSAAGVRAVPTQVVTFDGRINGVLRLDASTWDALTSAVGALLSFHARLGLAELYRRWTVEDLVAAVAPSGGGRRRTRLGALAVGRVPVGSGSSTIPYGLDAIFGRFAATPGRGAILDALRSTWRAYLGGCHHLPEVEVADGALVVAAVIDEIGQIPPTPGLGGDVLVTMDAQHRVWLGPGRPQPGLFGNRLHSVLGDCGPADALRRSFVQWEDVVVDVVGADPVDPGAVLRADVAKLVVDAGGRCGIPISRLDSRPTVSGGPGSSMPPEAPGSSRSIRRRPPSAASIPSAGCS